MLKKFCRYETFLYLRSINLKTTNMNKEQIIELIRSQEAEMYQELLEMREAFGPNDRGTLHSAAQWNAISNLLELIENAEN
jgi:hypothetical protein